MMRAEPSFVKNARSEMNRRIDEYEDKLVEHVNERFAA